MTNSAASLDSRVALVTGGTSGIGRATALALARQGMEVIITGRDASRTQAAVTDLQRQSGNPRVTHLLADFCHLAEVRALAQQLQATHPRLHVLVNNAGGTFDERRLTPDGFERTWALNHLASVELTLTLLPLLRASAPARIVNVASGWYARRLDFTNLQGERRYSAGGAYLQSKLANHLFTLALARRLDGLELTVNAVNPGIVDTGIARDARGLNRLLNALITPLKRSPERGAFPAVHLASSPEVQGINGRFFNKDRFAPTTPITLNEALQDRLWHLSLEQLATVGLHHAPLDPAMAR